MDLISVFLQYTSEFVKYDDISDLVGSIPESLTSYRFDST